MRYGVISRWEHEHVVWYDTLKEAFEHASTGDIVVKKIEEI